MTIRRGAAATGVLIAMTGWAFPGEASAADDTFRCDPGFYQVISGQFAEFDPGADIYNEIGARTTTYNAMGYRLADGYIYGVGNGELYRINADGERTTVGSLPGVPSGYTGTFGDDGLLHVSSGGADWYTLDVDTLEATRIPELSVRMGAADITNVNGIFYGVSNNGDLIRIDPKALTVQTVAAVSGLPSSNQAYGAAWSTAGGNLYVGRNSGEIYQITGYSTGAPRATQVGIAPSTNSNDGASCELAPPPAGLADVDGAKPETEPSTPEGKAAAEEYERIFVEPVYEIPDAGFGSGDSCSPTVISDRPSRIVNDRFVRVDEATSLFSTKFDGSGASDFAVLSGEWALKAGSFAQVESCDFDATVLLRSFNVDHFRWEATFQSTDGSNQGGLLINQSSTITRSGATLVDLADGGSIVRWGQYDDAGYYRFIGSQPIKTPAAGQSIAMSLEVRGAKVSIEIDGEPVASFSTDMVGGMVGGIVGGMVGLVATQSQIAFTGAALTALPADGGSL